MSQGRGEIKISNVLSEQIELLESLSIDAGNINVDVDKDRNVGIQYSYKIDDYNSVAAMISGVPGINMTVGYAIKTSDKRSNSVTTSIKFAYNNNTNRPPSSSVYQPVAEKSKSKSWEDILTNVFSFGLVCAVVAFGGTVGVASAPIFALGIS